MEFIADSIKRFKTYKELAEKTFAQLSDEDFFYRPNSDTNNIAIIIQHMYGNMLSRFTNMLTEDGEKAWRKRDAEFEDSELTRQDLMDCWNTGWQRVFDEIGSFSTEDIEKEITIRGEKHFVYDAIFRQLTHYAYHVGQIVYIGKTLKAENWQHLSMPKATK